MEKGRDQAVEMIRRTKEALLGSELEVKTWKEKAERTSAELKESEANRDQAGLGLEHSHTGKNRAEMAEQEAERLKDELATSRREGTTFRLNGMFATSGTWMKRLGLETKKELEEQVEEINFLRGELVKEEKEVKDVEIGGHRLVTSHLQMPQGTRRKGRMRKQQCKHNRKGKENVPKHQQLHQRFLGGWRFRFIPHSGSRLWRT